MSKKKILWISILIVFVIAIIIIAVKLKPKDNTNAGIKVQKNTTSSETQVDNEKSNKEDTEYAKKEVSDGILYSKTGKKVDADIVLGDNYFDTTIKDMALNPNNYLGKKIEIEGMYFSNDPYTFVGRYSTSNMCPNCPTGYSYIEYELDGKIDQKFTDGKEWLKVIGTFSKGQDNFGTNENPQYQDYYYIKVMNLEVMNERGKETVNN